MTESPWVKWYTSDFLNGVGAANLKADEIGIYTVVLTLIADRGTPIDNDRAWIAGRAGTSTRRCNQVIDRLIGLGKLEVRGNQIGNPKMIDLVQQRDRKSDQARAAAWARWHGASEPQLPLDESSADKTDLNAGTNRFKVENKIGKNERKPQKSAVPDNADASPPRASARSESRGSEESSPTAVYDDWRQESAVVAEIEPNDLLGLTHRLAKIGAVALIRPSAIASNMDTVKAWLAAGYDIEELVVPTITARVADTPEPTIASLHYFSGAIAKAYAHRAARTKGRPARRTAEPILHPEGEDRQFTPLRQTLLKELGPATYAAHCNDARFSASANGKDEPVLKITDHRPPALQLVGGDRAPVVKRAAAKHGFNHVWS